MTQIPSESTSPNANNHVSPQDIELLESAAAISTSSPSNSPSAWAGSEPIDPRLEKSETPLLTNVVLPQSRHLRVRLKNSIGSRLFFYVLGGALVGLGSMAYLFYQTLETQSKAKIQGILSTRVESIETQLAQVEQSMIGLNSSIQTLDRQEIDDPDLYKDLTFDFFKQRPELTMGLGFGQTANQIVEDRQWYYPYFYLDQKVPGQVGQLLPAPNQTIRYAELWAEDKYPEQDYYKILVNSKKPQWYEPYQWYGIAITTHARPILNDQEELIGLTTLDVNVTAIGEQIQDPVLNEKGYFAILSTQGNLLAYPPDPQQASELASYQDIPQLKAVWEKIGQENTGLVQVGGSFWAYQRIQGTNWLMLASVPTSVVSNPVLAITLGSALGAGGVLALVVFVFVRRFNRRLQPLLDECNRLAESDAQRAIRLGLEPGLLPGFEQNFNIANADELQIVTQSFQQVTAQLRDSFNILEETNRDLEQRVEERTVELKQAKEASETDKQTIQRRALELLREVDPISKGDLTIRAKVTPDEIGTLADSYNATVASLRKIVAQVQNAADQVIETTEGNEVYIQTLSAEAGKQAVEITDALEQIERMTQVGRVVAANAEQAETIVQQATQTVQEGDAAMNRTVDGIQAIRSTVAETARKVKHLGESSQKISTVVELISAFASQTNMLALNASIEASRAGESGRGFAIVASEVRALAQRSAEATEEIRKLVSSIQAETNEVVVAMESGTEQVVIGTKLVDETRQSLNKITSASAKISALVESIAQATVVQSEAAETVTQTMQGVASSANKTSAEANQVASSFEQLQTVAQTLQASVDRFKVR
ncbi:MAG: methyl-accepting chemotaxis protein [Cyanobacteria bacterium RM1_2_2]|nr:methyl-accepting chemotaxis protein [Cyanobacteria bacterium RM1_2_2]